MIRVGTSGWLYPHWRDRFYPRDLPARGWLRFAAERMGALEVNTTFYGSPRPSTFVAWRDEVADLEPRGFRFAIKGSRFLTHVKRLRDPGQALANFFATGVLLLGGLLGPILWQLPPQLPFDEERLDAFLSRLPRRAGEAQLLARGHDARFAGRASDRRGPGLPPHAPLRYAIEPRHPSFQDPAFLALCRRHRVAAVVADLAGRQVSIAEVTAPFAYARLHGSRRRYAGRYTDDELDAWAERVRVWQRDGAQEVYVFFDNDARAHAALDASRLFARLGPCSGSPSMRWGGTRRPTRSSGARRRRRSRARTPS